MALELKQHLRLSQQLVMTPQLQQAIKLLQLNRLELAQHVMTEMAENPILEEEIEEETEEKTASEERKENAVDEGPKEVDGAKEQGKDDINWENYLNSEPYQPSTGGGFKDSDPDLPSFESMMTKTATLADHLSWQLHVSNFPDTEKQVATLLIGNIDDDGYLRISVEEIATSVGVPLETVEQVLGLIQLFDPVGVGARDLRECLLVQTRQLPEDNLVRKLISNHLPDLERKAYSAIGRTCGVTIEDIVEAVRKMGELEPKPGRRFYDESNQYITPDIYVYKVGDEFVIVLNEDGLPKLKISQFYQTMLRGNHSSSKAKEYINDKLRSAIWLIRSIHQRQRTISKVTESIVKMQRDFLEYGISRLRPMVLRDVAEDIGMHESTVSRVTSNKYIHTPQGIFELKFFFNSSIRRLEGADVASEAVKERIRLIVQGEDAKRPYSDQEIVDLLRQYNIDIARRTVAKYREMMGILSSSKRKRPY